MIDIRNYEPSMQYGAKITGAEVSLTKHYVTLSPQSAGTSVAVGVFGTTTAPVTGTITGFFVIAGTTAANNVALTTAAGTVALIAAGTTIGLTTGTAVLNIAVASGDTVTINGSTNNPATAYIVFQTPN